MCDDCFKNLFHSFESQKEFDEFEIALQNKCINKKLEIIKPEKTDLTLFDSDSFYKCNSCGEIWSLSIPENAWRGFFLPQKEGIRHVKKLKQKDSDRQIGCLILILILVLIIIFRLMT
jgi:hypothetical protein